MMDRIAKMLSEEEHDFFMRHKHYPVGREIEDVVDNVYPQAKRECGVLSYSIIYEYYSKMRTETEQSNRTRKLTH